LLAIPRTAAVSAKLCDNFAEFFKRSHSELFDFAQDRRRVAESQNLAALILGFITGFLDLARDDVQIRQSERCVPNSEISPEDFLLT
jgi:hypothetical protein